MKLNPVLCPCGCGKWILKPLCNCQCSSVSKADADDAARRFNHFDELRVMLQKVDDTMTQDGGEDHPWIPGTSARPLRHEIRALLTKVLP